MNRNSEPIKQHYLPQVYLKGFTCEDKTIWQYDKKLKKCSKNIPKNFAFKRNYYTVDKPNVGYSKYNVEKVLFAKNIERNAQILIDKLCITQAPIVFPLTIEEKVHLSLFLAFLHTRTPVFALEVKIMKERIIKPLLSAHLKYKFHEKFSDSSEDKIGNDIYVDIPKDSRISTMIDAAQNCALSFAKMNWTLMSAPDDAAFIICDNPMIIYSTIDNGRGCGIKTPGAKKIIPLNSKFALKIEEIGTNINFLKLNKKEIRKLNSDLVRQTHRFLYSQSELQINKLIEIAGDEPYNPYDHIEGVNIPISENNRYMGVMHRRKVIS